jgi:hypothetical protein
MLNPFVITFFTKWCGGLMAKTFMWSQGDQGSIPLTNIYYVEHAYLYIYLVHVYKYLVNTDLNHRSSLRVR